MADDRRPERTEPSENRPPAHATAGNSTSDGDTCDPGFVERVHRGDRGLEGISFGPLLFGGSRIVQRPAAPGQLRRYPGALRFPRFSALVHNDLRAVRGGLADSFRRLINGEPWKRFCSDYGVEHHVRSMEVTHGKHGWHPHLHVLFFLEARLPEDEVNEATVWLQRRWASCVRRVLGGEFVPNEHGVDLRESRRADYLTKFSFELTDPGTKRGRGQNRTPLQIAVAAASGKCAADAALWVAYCAGMRGAKMLTWSRGSREALSLTEDMTDAAIVDGEEAGDAEPIATLTGSAWLSVRGRRGLACAILEAAELAATQADAAARIQALVWGTAPPEVPP